MTSIRVYMIFLCLYNVTTISAKPKTFVLLEQNNAIRAKLERQEDYFFMIRVRIGTCESKPKYWEYSLQIDTSIPLTWLQEMFPTIQNAFPQNSSKSFRPILPSDKLCLTKQSHDKYCSYNVRDSDKSYTSGILARKQFSLYSPKLKRYINLDNIVFGCGMVQNRIAKCKSYLRFGADAESPKQSIGKIAKLDQVKGSTFYYVELEGISVNDQRLKIDSSVFRVQENKKSWSHHNSGAMLSRLIRPAYDVLDQGLDSAFKKLNTTKGIHGQGRSCYLFKPGKVKKYSGVPKITYHFKGDTDLIIKEDALFTVFLFNPNRAIICLGIYPNDKMTVIEANQQFNHWFTFDTKNNQLSFHSYNCKNNIKDQAMTCFVIDISFDSMYITR